jgi:hypothetical protein
VMVFGTIDFAAQKSLFYSSIELLCRWCQLV